MNKFKNFWHRTKRFLITGGNVKFNKYHLALFAMALIIGGGLAVSRDIYAAKNKTNNTAKTSEPEKIAEVKKEEPVSETTKTETVQPPIEKPAPVAKSTPNITKKPVASVPAKPKASSVSPAPASAPAPSTAMTISGILGQVNYQRNANGLGKVSLNSQLNSAAATKAKHMADNNYFSHTAPDGTTDFFFISQAGYSYQAAGINLAMGEFGTSKGLVDAWMNSPGHRANILASFGREIGIGIFGNYYVMMIANPR